MCLLRGTWISKKVDILAFMSKVLLLIFYFYQVDPFLQLVEDCKLQVAKTGQGHPRPVYGSKEDNEHALKSLSVVDTSDSQSKESFARLILQTLQNLSEVSLFYSFFFFTAKKHKK